MVDARLHTHLSPLFARQLRWIKVVPRRAVENIFQNHPRGAVMVFRKLASALTLAVLLWSPARAQDALVTFKSLSPELALDLARAALADCRKRGYQVAVAVVDRFGVPQVMLRDRFAGPHTPGTAAGKGWTAVSFRTNTMELVAAAKEGMPQSGVRQLPGAVILGGGVMIEAGGSLVGGIGVSGAPGGEADEACAKSGIEAVRDKLEF
jgi:uncharacterized protein GlcG (DUF336 family)